MGRRHFYRSAWLLCLVILAGLGCAYAGPARVVMNVTAYPDPDVAVPTGARFCTVPLGSTTGGLMLEKNLLALVRERLVARGYIYDADDPELLVGLAGYIGPFQEYVPRSTFYWPMPKTESSHTTGSAWTSGGASAWGTATTTTKSTQYVPMTTGGYSVTQYYRNIEVLVARLVPRADTLAVDLVWTGSVESSGSNGDLLIVAPTLLDELMGEFPRRSGKTSSRTVHMRPLEPGLEP